MALNPVKIKFCGMTRPEDAQHALDLGAWAVGMVFYEQSPRNCPVDVAAEISAAVRRQCESVGVFCNAPLAMVGRIAEDANLTIVQLHGDEGPSYCDEIARRTGCEVIKAARVKSSADVLGLRVFRTNYHLLDAHVPGSRGGTGESFPWELAAGHRGSIPVILAGGLRPDNVAEAVDQAHPFAVDVASGVELSPGVKDHRLMDDFALAARGPSLEESPV